MFFSELTSDPWLGFDAAVVRFKSEIPTMPCVFALMGPCALDPVCALADASELLGILDAAGGVAAPPIPAERPPAGLEGDPPPLNPPG